MIPISARGAIRKAPDSWNRWLQTCEAIEADQADPEAEDYALFLSQFSELRRIGIPFDPGFVAKVEALKADSGLLDTFVEDTDDSHDIGDSHEERIECGNDSSGLRHSAAEQIWWSIPRVKRRKDHPVRRVIQFIGGMMIGGVQ